MQPSRNHSLLSFASSVGAFKTGLLAALVCCGSASALGDADFRDVPRVTAIDPDRFRAALLAAQSDLVRIAVFGDSQESEPAASGDYYLANLNASFVRILGAPTETNVFANVWSTEYPRWLATMDSSTALAASSVSDASLPPGFVPTALVNDPKAFTATMRTVLIDDAALLRDDSLEGGAWLVRDQPFVADILAVSRVGSGALEWRNEPIDGNLPIPAAAVQSGTLRVPSKAALGEFVWISTPPLDRAGRLHHQIALRAQSTKAPFEFVGIRFRSTAPPRGVVVQSFAKGGLSLGAFLSEHAECSGFFRAWQPSVAVLHFGTNDIGLGATLEQWRTRLSAGVIRLRELAGDPGLPIIIASELRCGVTQIQRDLMDRLPVAAHEIALGDPNVLALNLTRITAEEYRWDEFSFYLADTVHYRPYAQRLLAAAFVGELTRVLGIPDPACSAPNWADCIRAWGASCRSGGCVSIMNHDALESNLPWSGVGSTCDDADGDGYVDVCGSGGPADVNRDGMVDAADLTVVLGTWGLAHPFADINGDGIVDAIDMAILLSEWTTP